MKIEVNVGQKTYQLCGAESCMELREPRNIKNKDTGKVKTEWTPCKWFPTLAQAINCLLEMKVRSSDADSFAGLQLAIKQAKEELMGLYELSA